MSKGFCSAEQGKEDLRRRPPCPAPHPPLRENAVPWRNSH